jgi:hypothetical protein
MLNSTVFPKPYTHTPTYTGILVSGVRRRLKFHVRHNYEKSRSINNYTRRKYREASAGAAAEEREDEMQQSTKQISINYNVVCCREEQLRSRFLS